nr:scaffold protein [Ustilaginoidea virens polymycovirus 1]
MADLARLRHMLLAPDFPALMLAAMCHHIVPDPTVIKQFDYSFSPKARDFIVSAPSLLFGSAVPALEGAYDAVTTPLRAMEYQSLDLSSVVMRSMRLEDNPFEKTTRGETTGSVALSLSGAARHSAQSPIEFATYEVLREAGYVSIADALSKLQIFLSSVKAEVHVINRQFRRNRTAAFFLFSLPGSSTRTAVLTPFFTSREATRIYFAILLRKEITTSVARAAAIRGATVLGYAARASLDAVRRVVLPAQAIVDTYVFDDTALCFRDASGDAVYLVTDRTPSVVVAFSRVFSGGSTDICTYASQLRTELDVPGGPTGSAAAYFQAQGSVAETITAVAGVLEDSRNARLAHDGGHELNKDGGLSYFARDRSMKDRNTAACVTRIEEVAALQRSLARHPEDMVFIVEWGGKVNYDTVLAAVALTGATACVDVGTGAFKIGESSESGLSDDDDKGAYVCLIPKADTRGLPRMPIVGYEPSDSITQRVERLLDFVSGDNIAPVVYITGGATTTDISHADVIGTTLARKALLSEVLPAHSFFCGDVIIQPVCTLSHSDDGVDCLNCANFEYCVTSVGDECATGEVSLVKPRASYAHNTHFSIEWIEGADPEWVTSRTLLALDAVVATNVARNADWGDYQDRSGGRRPGHPEYGRRIKLLLDDVYRELSRESVAEVGATRSIVQSLVAIG